MRRYYWPTVKRYFAPKSRGALVISGEMVATQVRRNIQKSPRGGRTYIKTNPNQITQSICAGESPATDLGFWYVQFKYSLILITCASVLLAYIVLLLTLDA